MLSSGNLIMIVLMPLPSTMVVGLAVKSIKFTSVHSPASRSSDWGVAISLQSSICLKPSWRCSRDLASLLNILRFEASPSAAAEPQVAMKLKMDEDVGSATAVSPDGVRGKGVDIKFNKPESSARPKSASSCDAPIIMKEVGLSP